VIDAAQSIAAARAGRGPDRPALLPSLPLPVKPMAELGTRYYLRLEVADRPGVLAQIARSFGDNQVSIASVIQKETDEASQTAELVVMTHLAREADMQRTMREVAELEVVSRIGNFLRVEN
jgi:homoserine dehydrogenase